MLALVAMSRAEQGAAVTYFQRLIDSGRAEADDYNNAAWSQLVAGRVTPATLSEAQRAVDLAGLGPARAPKLHTLAALYAELDRPEDARRALAEAIGNRGEESAEDAYVLGRLAEVYGLPEVARVYYARVTPPREAQWSSAYLLAQRRLAGLAPAPPSRCHEQAALPPRAGS